MYKKIIISLIGTSIFLATGALAVDISSGAIKAEGSMGVQVSVDELGATGECPPDQEVVGQTNSIPPSIICAPIKEKTGSNPSKLLPTVNKATDDENDPELQAILNSTNEEDKEFDQADSERVLPTVNKKSLAKVEVRGWDPEKKELIEKKIQETLDENESITSATIAEDSVAVNYTAPAKLFWFLPINMNINVEAGSDHRIKVKFPWYRFLVSTNYSNIAQEADWIFQNNQTNLEFLRKQDPAEAQVETMITISNILKARKDPAVNAIMNLKKQ